MTSIHIDIRPTIKGILTLTVFHNDQYEYFTVLTGKGVDGHEYVMDIETTQDEALDYMIKWENNEINFDWFTRENLGR
jgi:hypothetical protein